MNRRPQNKTGFKGVVYIRNGYEVRIRLSGKDHYCGRFKTAKDAAVAYNAKAKTLFGEFAWLNPIA